MKPTPEEVGDLFVSQSLMTLKLMPSRKSGSKPIHWFNGGSVSDHAAAARDIASLVNKLRGRTRVVRGLTLMTERGVQQDLSETGLLEAVSKAGFHPLN